MQTAELWLFLWQIFASSAGPSDLFFGSQKCIRPFNSLPMGFLHIHEATFAGEVRKKSLIIVQRVEFAVVDKRSLQGVSVTLLIAAMKLPRPLPHQEGVEVRLAHSFRVVAAAVVAAAGSGERRNPSRGNPALSPSLALKELGKLKKKQKSHHMSVLARTHARARTRAGGHACKKDAHNLILLDV